MHCRTPLAVIVTGLALAFTSLAALAADFPAPKEGTFIARDFKFHTGEVMPELKLAYTTIGEPSGEPVLVLHGTTGSAASMLGPTFGGELFGKGQPLDATKHFIVLPDAIGHGKSSKPSDGLRTKFPKYNYDDMVEAHYRLIKDGLGIRHLRLVIGNSMGGMHTWLWGAKYPDYYGRARPNGRRNPRRWRAATGCCVACWSTPSAPIPNTRTATTRPSRTR